MEATTDPLPTVPAPAPGSFRWQKLPVWLVCCAALGILIAWFAVVAREYAAPLVLFPLVVGAVLGGMLVLAMRILDVGHRPTAWFGALLAGLLTVAGEHYFIFWKTQQRLAEDPDRTVKLRLVAPERVPPPHFREFMQWSAVRGAPIGGYTVQGGWAWLIWSLDGLLVLVPAMFLVGATARLPYCNRCRQWHHTVRSGRLDSRLADELRGLIAADSEGNLARGRYRLLACQEACGPTGLVLSGEGPDGRPCTRTIWLDTDARQRVVLVLDELSQRQAEVETTKAANEDPVVNQNAK